MLRDITIMFLWHSGDFPTAFSGNVPQKEHTKLRTVKQELQKTLLFVYNYMSLTEIHKNMSPDITAAKPYDQLSGMHLNMACHHNQVTDYSADPAALYFPLLTGSPASNCTLTDHSEDIVCY